MRLFRKHVALPGDHGSWVFLFSPLLIGLWAGGRLTTVSWYLVAASLCGFLSRQPITILVKVASGRRGRSDLAPAVMWTSAYAAIGLLHVAAIVVRGFGHILLLAVPGVPVFAWYLFLVSRKQERRRIGVELCATAVLGLSATAGYWIGVGRYHSTGWLLWALVWIQTAASIVYAYLRLEQRSWPDARDVVARVTAARGALALTTLNAVAAAALSAKGIVPGWLFAAYLPQWLETVAGTIRPAVGMRPVAIGMRQLVVSIVFTLLFMLAWRP
jgi:hypothetical protein